jgi:DNA-binding beta-propeller fold protein YncE
MRLASAASPAALAALVALVALFGALGCPQEDEPTTTAALPPGVTVIAGTASRGIRDGVGAAARFDGPAGIATSPDGSIAYVADTFVGTIRKVELATGAVTTLAGRPFELAAIDGSLEDARFGEPRGLAVSPGGEVLWVGDGPALRAIDLARGEVTTVAGDREAAGDVDDIGGAARFGFLMHDLEDDGTRVLIADRVNDKLRAFDPGTRAVTTLATGFDGPGGLARDASTLYVADTFRHVVKSVDLASGEVQIVAGQDGRSGASDGASGLLAAPQGVELVEGALYTLGFDGRLARIDPATGAVSTVLRGDPGAPTLDGPFSRANVSGTFASPAAAGSGLIIVDLSSSAVRRIELGASTVKTIAGVETPWGHVDGEGASARFQTPYAVAASADGARIFVADTFNHAVRLIEPGADGASYTVKTLVGGAAGRQDGGLAEARLRFPVGLALDEDQGLLYVADSGNAQVRVLDLGRQTLTTLAGSGASGSLDGPAASARFDDPWHLALDRPAGHLYVADSSGNAVRRVRTSDGSVETVLGAPGADEHRDGPLGTSRIRTPVGLALVEGTLYVSDFAAHTLRALDTATLEASTVLGEEGFEGFSEGGPGFALLAFPSGLSASADGRSLFVAETGNHIVRQVSLADFESIVFAGQGRRSGGLPTGTTIPLEEATLADPEDVVAVAYGVIALGDHGVWRIVPAP